MKWRFYWEFIRTEYLREMLTVYFIGKIHLIWKSDDFWFTRKQIQKSFLLFFLCKEILNLFFRSKYGRNRSYQSTFAGFRDIAVTQSLWLNFPDHFKRKTNEHWMSLWKSNNSYYAVRLALVQRLIVNKSTKIFGWFFTILFFIFITIWLSCSFRYYDCFLF